MTSNSAKPLLSVLDLVVDFDTPRGVVRAVDGVSFDIWPGEVLSFVGESGCGKTVTALALLRLLPQVGTHVRSGRVLFDGVDLLGLDSVALRAIRGKRISMIFQDPTSSLNPMKTIERQIEEAIKLHQPALTRIQIRDRVVHLMVTVGIADARKRMKEYPHMWSGGMRQRAMIAMAMANEPVLLIADEPTTGLDTTVQAQVLDVLRDVRSETGAAMLLITHNLGVVAEIADRVAVIYAGRIVETRGVEELFTRPLHPYTQGLMSCQPSFETARGSLRAIGGQPPQLDGPSIGCTFRDRCALRFDRNDCATIVPQLSGSTATGGQVACHAVGGVLS